MLKCSKEAFAACPTRHLCGRREEATFAEGSECDMFNRQIRSHTMTHADRIRAENDDGLKETIHAFSLGFKPWCDFHCENEGDDGCDKCIENWLQQPVEVSI